MKKKTRKETTILTRKKELTRNSGTMTEAQFIAMVKNALRGASMYWKPKADCIRKAKVGYNQYKCSMCGAIGPSKLPPLPGKKRKRHNIVADHIHEVVDPDKGFQGWDSFIERLFVEEEGYQALCFVCNHKKTQENQTTRRISNNNKKL